MKNVFITGVSGYIGTKIVQALSHHASVKHIVGIDIREPTVKSHTLTFIRQDVRDSVLDLLKTHKIDTVIHAAYVLPPGLDTKNIEEINVAGPDLNNPLSTHLKKPWVMLPKKTSPFQFVHEDDLVRVMVLCLEKKLAEIFNVKGECSISFVDMVKTLGTISK
ncbi:MAG: NAD-dependent epimerase/dehydratase family protein [Proteobacteria bacterium]|nr:NAD-dependent epimerase/dehydratase family protein [Pseudomonadota bacterium]